MTDRDLPEFYADGGLNAALYSSRVAGPDSPNRSGDIAFYLSLAEQTGGPVLELGCGPGRVAFPLARSGYPVVGLDLAQGMLAHAHARLVGETAEVRARTAFVHGDMTDFELHQQFGLVLAPFRSFQALLTPEAQRSCLRAAARHLRPDGILVLELFDPLFSLLEPGVVEEEAPNHEFVSDEPLLDPETTLPVEVDVLARTNHTIDQVLDEVWRFRVRDADGVVTREEHERLRMRWTYRWELRHLLELCGFHIEAEYSDFAMSPPAYGKEQIVVARPDAHPTTPRRR